MAGNALSTDEWSALPQLLSSQEVAYYLDTATGNVMLVWPGDQSTAFKAAFSPSGKMDTAFRVSHESIAASVKSGQWAPL